MVAALLDDRARPTEPYALAWSLHPSVLLGVGLLGILYLWGVRRITRAGSRPPIQQHDVGAGVSPPVSRWRVGSFIAGLVLMAASLNGPIHDLSDYYLFSAHMVQHLLLTLVVPPLLLGGAPREFIDPLLRRWKLERVARFLTKPLAAGMLYSAVLAVWHLPGPYDLMMRNHDVHVATHLLFIAMAVLMWWPVLSLSEVAPPASPGIRMLYLFLVGIPMQVIAAPISLSETVLYPWYEGAPRTWGLSPRDDQQLGGVLMWVPGGFWVWGAAAVEFFRWAKREELEA